MRAVVSHGKNSAVHCINPDCKRPFPQPWGNKFCNNCGAPLQLENRYVPLQTLGSGGFAQIYTVWDLQTQTEKVLKILVETSWKALELFEQEAAVLRHLRHPGVPKVESDGMFKLELCHPQPRQMHCLVMEKINGMTLEEIQKNYPQGCPQGLVLNWLTQAVEILKHLHECKIIHRDIKPSNMMLRSAAFSRGATPGDQLVLIDFGGVKQFNSNMRRPPSSTRLFSSGYSPPEQVIGGNVSPATDFYALGRTMVELLTGRNPVDLEDSTIGELQWRHLVTVKPQLGDLLDEMIKPDARSRPATTAIIQRRLAQMSQISVGNGSFRELQQSLGNVTQQITTAVKVSPPLLISQISTGVIQGINFTSQLVSRTVLFLIQTVATTVLACLSTVWAMLLTGTGAALGTMIGALLTYQTGWGRDFAALVSNQIMVVLPESSSLPTSDILLFASAGLGTAWGITTSGVFNQQRRYAIASITSIIGYCLSWFALQGIATKSVPQGVTVFILVAVTFLTLGIRFRSHHIVYSIIAALGTALSFAFLISLNLFPIDIFVPQVVTASNLLLKAFFFSFVGVLVSFFVAISHYTVIPWLRILGWK
jgi:serine/threonine protein kinase